MHYILCGDGPVHCIALQHTTQTQPEPWVRRISIKHNNQRCNERSPAGYLSRDASTLPPVPGWVCTCGSTCRGWSGTTNYTNNGMMQLASKPNTNAATSRHDNSQHHYTLLNSQLPTPVPRPSDAPDTTVGVLGAAAVQLVHCGKVSSRLPVALHKDSMGKGQRPQKTQACSNDPSVPSTLMRCCDHSIVALHHQPTML